jgi:arsenate reductase
MNVAIYHNARCSKSRATMALLEEQGITPRVVNYLTSGLRAEQVANLVRLLGVEPDAIVRFNESVAAELGLASNDTRSRAEWCQIIAEHPILLERPIVVVDETRAAIGRPPEAVLALLTEKQ